MASVYGKTTTEIRRELHSAPEKSGEEVKTSDHIAELLSKIPGMEVHRKMGIHGVVGIKRYGEGNAVGFRAELDALPVFQESNASYKSQNEGVSHVCGHDGHMVMVLDLLDRLEAAETDFGTVMVFFQSAEETGQGAREMVKVLKKKDNYPELKACFALHNIPGREKGKVFYRKETFACGSTGVEVNIKGRTAHAAHPEDAINPLFATAKLMQFAAKMPDQSGEHFALCTPIALHSGSQTFGTSPADATLLMTLRSEDKQHLKGMMKAFENEARRLTEKVGAECNVEFHEYFPPTVNTDFCSEAKNACQAAGIKCASLDKALRWSEDFAHFSKKYPIFLAGIGSGENQPALHAPDFDFPDELIEKGSAYFGEMYKTFAR
ncbi:MAG: amidohydrolase [Flavobacteriales bacterium]|nr:amidohydrolase [Flavobacteriales bacterium]